MKPAITSAVSGLALLAMLAGGESIAATKAEIDAGAAEALTQFDQLSPGHKELDAKAEAALVFPRVTKAGVGIAGEYGEGVLLINGKSVGYYSLSSASVGLTFGAETHKEIILFMNMQALNRFTSSDGWSAGADAGAAVASKGAGAEYDSKTKGRPVQGFVFSEKGLIGDLSLEGSKVKKIER